LQILSTTIRAESASVYSAYKEPTSATYGVAIISMRETRVCIFLGNISQERRPRSRTTKLFEGHLILRRKKPPQDSK